MELLSMRSWISRRLAPFILLWACVPATTVNAQAPANEAEAKAKFTLTLARFVQWPNSAFPSEAAPLHLCVLHNSPAVAAAFGSQNGTLVAGHPLSVNTGATARGAACELLFIDGSAAQSSADALLQADAHTMLTLGAVDGFVSRGGMVELVNVDDTLRFDVNLKALRMARLGLSGQVLKLARHVRE
jgi:hypothetical protein